MFGLRCGLSAAMRTEPQASAADDEVHARQAISRQMVTTSAELPRTWMTIRLAVTHNWPELLMSAPPPPLDRT